MKIGKGRGGGGKEIGVPHQTALSWERHQAMSVRVSLVIRCLTKELWGVFECGAKTIEGGQEQPSERTKVQCCRHPKTPWTFLKKT